MKNSGSTLFSTLWISSFTMLAILCGCGGGSNCSVFTDITKPNPTGRWSGVMVRVESDCGDASRGDQFTFEHSVSAECDNDDDPRFSLWNEDDQEFRQISGSTFLGDASFTVQHEGPDTTIDISYDNYDGSLADVTQKIRLYVDGKIRCSELYKGQGRKE
jgi:hypothetical protein